MYMEKNKSNHSVLLVSVEKNIFIIIITSMLTLDLTKICDFIIVGELQEERWWKLLG